MIDLPLMLLLLLMAASAAVGNKPANIMEHQQQQQQHRRSCMLMCLRTHAHTHLLAPLAPVDQSSCLLSTLVRLTSCFLLPVSTCALTHTLTHTLTAVHDCAAVHSRVTVTNSTLILTHALTAISLDVSLAVTPTVFPCFRYSLNSCTTKNRTFIKCCHRESGEAVRRLITMQHGCRLKGAGSKRK